MNRMPANVFVFLVAVALGCAISGSWKEGFSYFARTFEPQEVAVAPYWTGERPVDKEAEAVEIVFVGSSFTKVGINEGEIEKRLNLKPRNAAIMGVGPPGIRGQFYGTFSKHPRVRIIVVEVMALEQRRKATKESASLSGDDAKKMAEMARVGRRYGVEIFFYIPPSRRSPPIPEGLEVINFDKPDKFPELFDPSVRKDETHLNEEGAKILSRYMSDALIARSKRVKNN